MALSAARGQGNLKTLTQDSRSRVECDIWYDLVLDVIQEAAYWPACKAQVAMGDRRAESVKEFQYSYVLPSDYLRAWYLTGFERFSIESSDWRDSPSQTGTTRLYTDVSHPVLVYAQRVVDTNRWTPAMTQAFVYGLAYKISESLTGKEELVNRLLVLANSYLERAQATSIDASGDSQILDSDPEWIRARTDSSALSRPARYFYPFGQVWTNAP